MAEIVKSVTIGRAADWDETEGGRPAPDCAHGLWLESSRWTAEHGQPDESGYVAPPAGIRCVGCAVMLAPCLELVEQVFGSDGLHYHCATCAAFIGD